MRAIQSYCFPTFKDRSFSLFCQLSPNRPCSHYRHTYKGIQGGSSEKERISYADTWLSQSMGSERLHSVGDCAVSSAEEGWRRADSQLTASWRRHNGPLYEAAGRQVSSMHILSQHALFRETWLAPSAKSSQLGKRWAEDVKAEGRVNQNTA